MKLETLCSRLAVEHPCESIRREFSKISAMLPDCPSDESLNEISDSCASEIPLLVAILLLIAVAIGLLIAIIYLLLRQKPVPYYEEVARPVQQDKSLQAIMSFSSSYECLPRQTVRTPVRRVVENFGGGVKQERPLPGEGGVSGTNQFPRTPEASVCPKPRRLPQQQQQSLYESERIDVKAELHPEQVGQVQLIFVPS